jgi:hypothetical protein
MSTRRAHVVLPEDLVREIDRAVGARKRSAFLADLARRELKRRRLLAILARPDPIWKDEDHPELANSSDAWVAGLRTEAEDRFQRTQKKDPD